MKLTEKQKEALQNISQGDVQYHRYGYGAWRITGPSNPSVVGRVISLGLARWGDAPNTADAKIASLTSSGLAALDAEA